VLRRQHLLKSGDYPVPKSLVLALTALALIGGVAVITSIEITPVIACSGTC
jgi:hypothetical protein